MVLIVAATAALALAGPTDTWEMGGGRTWMNPPKAAEERIRRWDYSRPSPKAQREAERQETALILDKARHGDVRAMRMTGFLMLSGTTGQPDSEGAMGWFYEAALRNDAPSMFILGCAFEYGVGVAPDPKLANYWRARAEAHGAPKTCI
jgi:TPR repeat protein